LTAGLHASLRKKLLKRGLDGGFEHPDPRSNFFVRQASEQEIKYLLLSFEYRGTVLTAFQNVADTLHALRQDADGLKAAVAARDAAKVTLDLTRRQLQVGYVNYLALLNAEQNYLQAVINLVQAQSNRFADTAALFRRSAEDGGTDPTFPRVD
jgi:outer membrane protein TolC